VRPEVPVAAARAFRAASLAAFVEAIQAPATDPRAPAAAFPEPPAATAAFAESPDSGAAR
jgi:hypothetical protein